MKLTEEEFLKSIEHLMDHQKEIQIKRRKQAVFLHELESRQSTRRSVTLNSAIEEISRLKELDLPVNGWPI